MRMSLKHGGCKTWSHGVLKDSAKNRVDDLQGIFMDLQSARKESRSVDIAVLEEQVYQMIREWKAELNQPSPAPSLQNGNGGSFSSDIYRMLQLCEEEDDATSPPNPEPDIQWYQSRETFISKELDNQHHLNLEYEQHFFTGFSTTGLTRQLAEPGLLSNIPPPPSAFLGPKCVLWDCPRPARSSEDYCSHFHAVLASNEGPPGMSPILRPGGISLKDGLLFASLAAKAQGKVVGIPDCAGAATTKSPWNAPELFDVLLLEGETVREWLFFDKPRRAFESGNRKQRSLPDYNGRGWHESRKQVMNEFGGLKRSYYMDPQPLNNYEWHLYEYEISNCDACALYRLELKLVVYAKKASRGKTSSDSIRLSDDFPLYTKRSVAKTRTSKGPYPAAQTFDYIVGDQYSYLVQNLSDYYFT